jgi:hypothetical protein
MDVTDLKAALNIVEQDHRFVLDRMQALKEIVSGLLEPGTPETPRILGRLREIDDYFAVHFTAHMEKEEATLFVLFEEHAPDGTATVGRLRLQHEEIRRKREDFGNCLEVALQLEGNLTPTMARDLLAYGWDLWDMLDTHARLETQLLHQCVGRYLQDARPPPQG